MALGEQNMRAACPKDKLEFKFFFKRCTGVYISWVVGLGGEGTLHGTLEPHLRPNIFGCYKFVNL